MIMKWHVIWSWCYMLWYDHENDKWYDNDVTYCDMIIRLHVDGSFENYFWNYSVLRFSDKWYVYFMLCCRGICFMDYFQIGILFWSRQAEVELVVTWEGFCLHGYGVQIYMSVEHFSHFYIPVEYIYMLYLLSVVLLWS